jgi:hypothetical protein
MKSSKRKLTRADEESIRRDVDAQAEVAHRLAFGAYTDAFRLYLENADELHVAVRCAEIYAAEIERHEREQARKWPDGAFYFLQRVDTVMEEAGDRLMVESPAADLFVFLFVRAAREWKGERAPNAYTKLLDLIRAVDGGADLAALYDAGKGGAK